MKHQFNNMEYAILGWLLPPAWECNGCKMVLNVCSHGDSKCINGSHRFCKLCIKHDWLHPYRKDCKYAIPEYELSDIAKNTLKKYRENNDC